MNVARTSSHRPSGFRLTVHRRQAHANPSVLWNQESTGLSTGAVGRDLSGDGRFRGLATLLSAPRFAIVDIAEQVDNGGYETTEPTASNRAWLAAVGDA